ncbi:hypothetical protein ACFQPA_01460 [Halomarina halobia]|uniref:Uncharacterized protein n=1 Tax=Halomarina halobia TaxID=3033386 RepID=A0ABD6A7F8_9EURY|nr:hypothetical protein [Halomarina sp. PSR21]
MRRREDAREADDGLRGATVFRSAHGDRARGTGASGPPRRRRDVVSAALAVLVGLPLAGCAGLSDPRAAGPTVPDDARAPIERIVLRNRRSREERFGVMLRYGDDERHGWETYRIPPRGVRFVEVRPPDAPDAPDAPDVPDALGAAGALDAPAAPDAPGTFTIVGRSNASGAQAVVEFDPTDRTAADGGFEVVFVVERDGDVRAALARTGDGANAPTNEADRNATG